MCIQYLVNIPINLQPKPKALTVSQSRPTQIIQTQTQQVQQPQITEEEYYRQQGVEQLQRIKAEQDRIQAKLNSAIENYNRRRTDSREKKVDFLQTQLNTLKELESKAATGKYDYDALASFAYDYANYQSNRGAQAPTQLTQKRSESNAEFEQRLIQQMKDKGEAYLQRQTTIAPTQISYSEPSKIGGPQPDQDLYANIDDITGYKGGPSIAYTKPVGGQAVVIKPTNKQTGYGRPTSPTQPKQYVYVPLEEVEKRGGFVPQPTFNQPTGITKIEGTPTQDKRLIMNPTYQGGGTMSYRPTTTEEMKILTKNEQYQTPLRLYEEKVVKPLAYEGKVAGIKVIPQPLAGTYSSENVLNIFKLYQQEVVLPLSQEGKIPFISNLTGYHLAPLGGIGGLPARSSIEASAALIGSGLGWWEKKVVIPLGEEIAETRNPITDIAKAKQYMDRLSNEQGPDTLVQLYIGGKMQNVRVGDYANMGLIDFMQKVYRQQVNAAWTQYAKDYSRIVYGKEVSDTTAGVVGKAADLTQQIVPYAIPGFFETEVGAKMAEAQLLKGTFGGPTSAVDYAMERPLEVVLASASVYANVVGKTARWASNTDKAKYEKYLTDKKVTKYDISRATEDKSKTLDVYRPQVKKTAIGPTGFEKISIGATKKGTININTQEPRDVLFGKVKEMAQLKNSWGAVQVKRLDGKISIDFSNPNEIVRVIKYDDGIVKIITTRGERITTELFTKNGELLFTETKSVPGFVDELIKYKTAKMEAKIDLNSLDGYVIKVVKQKGTTRQTVELTNIKTGEKTLIDIEDKLAKDILQKQGRDLLTGKLKVDYSAEEDYSQTVNKLLGRKITTERGLGDFIVSADKRAKVVFQSGAQKAKLEMATQQKIIYGVDTQSDVAFNIAGRGKAIKIDVKSAPFQRAIEQKFAERMIGYEITPTFKFNGKTIVPTAVSGKVPPAVSGKVKPTGMEALAQRLGVKIREPTLLGNNAIAETIYNRIEPIKPAVSSKIKPPVNLGGNINQSGGAAQALKQLGASKATRVEVKIALDYQAINYVAPVSTYIPAEAASAGPLSLTAPTSIIGPGLTYSSKLSIAGLSASLIIPKIKTKQDIATKQELNLFSLSQPMTDYRQDFKQELKTDYKQDFKQKLKTDYKQDFKQKLKTDYKQDFKQELETQPVISPPPTPTPTPPPRLPREYGGKIIPPIWIPGMNFGEGKQENIPYQGQVLVKGKYKTVTDKPYTKMGARDAIARIIDNTISAQGKVVKMNKKVPQDKISGGDGYYEANQSKFRGFKMFAGRKIPVGDTIIENKQNRIDTPGEANRMTVAQFTSRETKRAVGLPVRKRKPLSKRKTPFRL